MKSAYLEVLLFLIILACVVQANTTFILAIANNSKIELVPSNNPILVKVNSEDNTNGNLVTAASTLAGAALGAVATYFVTIGIEKRKLAHERETQATINENIKTLIREELVRYHAFFVKVRDSSSPLQHANGQNVEGRRYVRDDLFQTIQQERMKLTREYLKLDFQIKMLVFGAQPYLAIERAYSAITEFQFVVLLGHEGCFSDDINGRILEPITDGLATIPE